MTSLRRHSILPAVFMTGAVVLVIEVTATRILAPYFGTTVYSVSSILSVILAALSCGYFYGGRLADRHPDPDWFYGIIAAGGLSMLLLRLMISLLLPLFGYSFSYVEGPLFWSLFLFFLPCLLLGALSPFAIAIRQKHFPEKGSGTVSGEVFFWSTAGSIVGSLHAGFALIPHYALSSIISAMAFLLLAIGVVGMGNPRKLLNKRGVTLSLFAAAAVLLSTMQVNLTRPVYAKDGVYQHIDVYEGLRDGRPARFLQQDGITSSAMFLDSDEDVYPYTKYHEVYRLFAPKIDDALVIGGGAFTVPKTLLRDLPDARVDVVEIEPALVDVAKRFFKLTDDPRLHVHIDDGRRFLHDRPSGYDLIFSDVYRSLFFIPPHLATKEFFQAAKKTLRTNGIFVANVVGNPTETGPSFLFSEMRTFSDVFPNSYYFIVQASATSGLRNVIFVGVNGEKRFDVKVEARASEDTFVRELPDHLFDAGSIDLASRTPFTDDFAPVESMASRGFLEPGRRPTPFH